MVAPAVGASIGQPLIIENRPGAGSVLGTEMVVRALKDQGVRHIFGYPGGAVLPIYDALFQDNELVHVLVRHEQGAVHAAEGYARSTGKPGVVLVTSGPGATNAVTGLTDALMDSIPLVCITGQVPTHLIGSDAFQECDTVGITRPIVISSGAINSAYPPPLPFLLLTSPSRFRYSRIFSKKSCGIDSSLAILALNVGPCP